MCFRAMSGAHLAIPVRGDLGYAQWPQLGTQFIALLGNQFISLLGTKFVAHSGKHVLALMVTRFGAH